MQDYNRFADKNNNFYDDKTEIFFKTPLAQLFLFSYFHLK